MSVHKDWPWGEIHFSGPTYQVEILDERGKQLTWVFLELEEDHQVGELFSSEEEADPRCEELAKARIFDEEGVPLHIRFQKSLWNALSELYAHKIGYEESALREVEPGHFIYQSKSGKELFSLRAKGKQGRKLVESLLVEREPPTEETSLLFSHIPESELQAWRDGRPSEEMSYHLSWWNELAKWCMVAQARGGVKKIRFDQREDQTPERLHIEFDLLSLSFYLPEAYLPKLVPYLDSVDSPLPVLPAPPLAERLHYDPKSELLQVRGGVADEEGVRVGEWLLIPERGFVYAGEEKRIEKGEIEEFLDAHREELPWQEGPAPPYQLHFDEKWHLHLTPDVERRYGNWIYREGSFSFVKEWPFETPTLRVEEEQVAGFIGAHQVWLQEYPAFRPHLGRQETGVSFRVGEKGELQFFQAFPGEKGHTFGQWHYREGAGFFLQQEHVWGRLLEASPVAKEEVAAFIAEHEGELEQVEGFFTAESPIEERHIFVWVEEGEGIVAEPVTTFVGEERPLHIYEHGWAYVEGEGFFQLQRSWRLESFCTERKPLSEEEFTRLCVLGLKGLEVQFSDDLRPAKPPALKLLDAKEPSFRFAYVQGDQAIPVAKMVEGVAKGVRWLPTPFGRLDLSQERYRWLAGVKEAEKEFVSMRTSDLFRLAAMEEISASEENSEAGKRARELVEALRGARTEQPNTGSFRSTLRDYQNQGLRWLWFLYQHGLGGLLCDEMGLGKTHQAMALMAAIETHRKVKRTPRYLVVCPTSVLYHWKEKIEQFLPQLRPHIYHGTNRKILPSEILITSYGILSRDIEELKKIPFSLAIFDEMHAAKSAESRRYKACRKVEADMSLGLTGTPLENRLEELRTLIELVVPGYLPPPKEFREAFATPIERDQDEEVKKQLQKLVAPFILRRRKEDVLTELPPKTEEIVHCTLSDQQKELYNKILSREGEKLSRELENSGQPIPYIHIFSLLTKLKQVCNHPATVLEDVKDWRTLSSGKWDLFLELLEEARESGRKVVVFSQYLKMLDIIEDHLRSEKIDFASIRGATQDRNKQLKKFNKEESCEVFVGSLHAVGMGVDLTAGSVVIHYDRWWNAAKEEQATDRVHRLGQALAVLVFKLVTLGTFEERIDQLIEKKGLLLEEVVGASDQQLLQQLTRQELQALLRLDQVE